MRRAAAALVVLAWSALGAPASAAPYHSPGYKGNTSFKNVVPAPLPSISLGTGKYPNLLVDRAGTAHIVFAQDGGADAPDTVAFCNLQRGIKTCASSGLAPNPQAPDSGEGGEFSGNFPGGNHDTDGPVPLAIGNQLFVLDRRFPDAFHTPDGMTSQSNVFEWSSSDGGATITGPGQIGDNQMAGGAIAFGDPGAPTIGTISRTQTGSTTFQASPSGTYTTAKAVLGTDDQAYDGRLVVDGTLPVAAFSDLNGNVFVRKWTGQGDPNDATTWSQATFPGFSPQIIGGAAGVFVLYSDSRISGGTLRLQRLVNGAPSGAPAVLGTFTSDPEISEDPTGRIALAYRDGDRTDIEVRTSSNGVDFSPPELAAQIPAEESIAGMTPAATADGGGFVTFIRNATGAEAIGEVVVSAFGSQRANGQPGLGPLPGGGIGSAAGDQLATSTCQSAKFGEVDAEISAGCFGHDPKNPNLDVTLGELNLNGLRIIPDPGVRIGIDPRQHTIDTTGKVAVVLSAPGIDITLWHDELHVKMPTAEAGTDLLDLPKPPVVIKGFPVEGDIDVKLVKGGVDIPISLSLPKYFGGVTGSATLHASTAGGLEVRSLEFKVGDANVGAVELKDVDVSYTLAGNVWKGSGELLIPAGGGALDAKLEIEFDNGVFKHGSLDVGLPYPGIQLDDSDPPPQLYLSHVGLGLDLDPAIAFTGRAGLGLIPLKPPGEGAVEDYVFRLEGELTAAFGRPITITVKATGFLYNVELASAVLTYGIPDQVKLTGTAEYKLGMLKFKGGLSAIIDPRAKVYGAQIESKASLVIEDTEIPLPGSFAVGINNKGFGAYIGPPGIISVVPPFEFFGSVIYHWGDDFPKPIYGKNVTGQFKEGLPAARAAGHGARAAAAASFTVPAGAPTATVIVHGTGGAPKVALTGPNGAQVPLGGRFGSGEQATAIPDAKARATYVGISNPRAGRWTVTEASGSPASIARLEYAFGEDPPKVSAKLGGKGFDRTLRYRTTIPGNVAISFAEKTGKLLHVIGRAHGKGGTIRFHPLPLPAGRRKLVAQITNSGVPFSEKTLATYVVPKPPPPGRARGLRVKAATRKFTFTYTPPAHAAHVLVKIVATDGRRLQRIVSPRKRGGSVPVVGFRDGVKVSVIGLGAQGSRGPVVSAKARRTK